MLMKWYKNRQSINIHLQKRHYNGHKSYGFVAIMHVFWMVNGHVSQHNSATFAP